MTVFAMDTTSTNATVAIIDENKILGEFSVNSKNTHSQTIMPMTNEILKKCNMELCDIDVFAVCTGPGSFTGVRIGMSAVKTLCQALGKPIIGVTSFDALQANYDSYDNTYVCPIIDARGGNVYNAVYLNGKKITDNRIINIDDLLFELSGKNTVFLGDGILHHGDKIKKEPCFKIAPAHFSMQKASSVAYCALCRAKNDDYDNLYTLLPVYLRKSQAERELENKLNNN